MLEISNGGLAAEMKIEYRDGSTHWVGVPWVLRSLEEAQRAFARKGNAIWTDDHHNGQSNADMIRVVAYRGMYHGNQRSYLAKPQICQGFRHRELAPEELWRISLLVRDCDTAEVFEQAVDAVAFVYRVIGDDEMAAHWAAEYLRLKPPEIEVTERAQAVLAELNPEPAFDL
ncbi:hypothetical protein [Streptacidiphilus sp. EB103A]|uniref:hypothetical protein n=1 Tax=Streptacidiphilus sp. EB103A TaxID=3156275 RepID=UPI0035159CFD